MNRIGIVVLNYQTWELSLRCMQSIDRTCRGLEYRIYLVDNASEKHMPDVVRRYLTERKEIRFLQAKKNRGYAAGNNIGIAKALEDGCSVILVSNNDIIFGKQAVCKLADCLHAHPGAGVAGPKVIDEHGRIQPSRCFCRTGIKEIFQLYTFAKKIFRRKWKKYYGLDQDADIPSRVYHVSGCCFALSKECARKVTPLDEGTVLYDEELIVGIRAEQAGYSTWYEPQSIVMHSCGSTTKQVHPFMYQCISQSELYYCAKYLHAAKWQLWLLYAYRTILYLLRSVTDKKMREYRKTFLRETRKQYVKWSRWVP